MTTLKRRRDESGAKVWSENCAKAVNDKKRTSSAETT